MLPPGKASHSLVVWWSLSWRCLGPLLKPHLPPSLHCSHMAGARKTAHRLRHGETNRGWVNHSTGHCWPLRISALLVTTQGCPRDVEETPSALPSQLPKLNGQEKRSTPGWAVEHSESHSGAKKARFVAHPLQARCLARSDEKTTSSQCQLKHFPMWESLHP